jgi:Cu-Zn family superoxide dismutase
VNRTARKWLAIASILAAGGVATTALAGNRGPDKRGEPVAWVTLKDQSGRYVGTVSLSSTGDRVYVSGRVNGISPGFHGFHVHAVGICDPKAQPTPFATAGGHLSLETGANHGRHSGDFPPLLVNGDGTALATFVTDRFQLWNLFDADGSAVIVHADPDNLANIPSRYTSTTGQAGPDAATLATGDSGGRVACGVVRRG